MWRGKGRLLDTNRCKWVCFIRLEARAAGIGFMSFGFAGLMTSFVHEGCHIAVILGCSIQPRSCAIELASFESFWKIQVPRNFKSSSV